MELGWIPRKILETDVGLDMEVEVCENDEPTGQLIGLQIKSGKSYFKENAFGDVIFRGEHKHLKYWIQHSLPIILILHNPISGITIWQKIVEEKITRTNSSWKIEIPKSQVLNNESLDEIKKYNKLPLYFQRFQRLSLHKKLMSKINRGKYVILEIEEWVNKSSGKAKITIKEVDSYCNDIIISEGHYFHFHGLHSLEILYPWANFKVENDYYYDQEYDDFLNNYGIWDPEDKIYISASSDFREYRETLPEFRGLDDASGEIKYYRLEIGLNELGQSFLNLNKYLENGIQFNLDI